MSQKYSKEFKETIVSLYETGKSVSDLSREYGLASQTIYKWIKVYSKKQLNTEEMSLHDLQEMRKEMAIIKEENEILKKALGIFAKK